MFFCEMWAKIITIKRTKDLNYFSLCALNLFNTRVSQFELNYLNKWTFPRHSTLMRCTCTWRKKWFVLIWQHTKSTFKSVRKTNFDSILSAICRCFTIKRETAEVFLLWIFSRPAAVARPALCGSAPPARPHCPAAQRTQTRITKPITHR